MTAADLVNPQSAIRNPQLTIIAPPAKFLPVNARELWEYRELLYFFVARDLKVKYKQAALGVAWAVLQPLVAMVIFSVFFGRLAKLPSDGMPYPIFTFLGLLPWTYFATALQFGSQSLVANANLLRKVYFPRLLLPAGAAVAALVDLAIAMLVLLPMLWHYGEPLTMRALWTPVFIVLAFLTALGCGLWLSAINVKYRDVQFTVPFLIQIWLFATPVVYPVSLAPERWRFLFGLNPMAAVIEGFRWALTSSRPFPSAGMMTTSILVSLVVLVSGAYYFKRLETEFADVV